MIGDTEDRKIKTIYGVSQTRVVYPLSPICGGLGKNPGTESNSFEFDEDKLSATPSGKRKKSTHNHPSHAVS